MLARVPDARTAFSSPDRSLVLVFTNTQILALRHEGNALGVPFARVFMATNEIVSGQWAIGKHADAWAEQLAPREVLDRQNRVHGQTLKLWFGSMPEHAH